MSLMKCQAYLHQIFQSDVSVSSFQLVHVTSDFARVGRDHVTGEISAEVRMAPKVVVQAFWSKVVWNENDSAPTNSSHAVGYYDVPITGIRVE